MTLSIPRPTETVASQDQDVVLSVKGVSKKFCRDLKRSLFYGVQDIAASMTGLSQSRTKLRTKEFWALKNASFELRRGEALGLVGKNGSGKSTLLRIIAGLIKPDMGSIEVKGKVAPLIALGAGFNPILTGRENVYTNMSILGLSRTEIDDRLDEVLNFAEIGDAIDAPVQSYSSGMAARLGFASAIYTEPDILLIDEVLAVGDAKFRMKCHQKLHSLRQKGTAFVLVTHHSPTIASVCQSAVYLQKGEIITSGPAGITIDRYEEDLFLSGTKKCLGSMFRPEKPEIESSGLDIISLYFRDIGNNIIDSLISGEYVQLCIGCKAHNALNNISLTIGIKDIAKEGDVILYFGGSNDQESFDIVSGKHEIQVCMPHLVLGPGIYSMYAYLKKDSSYTLDIFESLEFIVRSNGRMLNSRVYQPRSWKLLSTKNI